MMMDDAKFSRTADAAAQANPLFHASLAAQADALAAACWLIAESTSGEEFQRAVAAAIAVLGAAAYLVGETSKAGSVYVSRLFCSLTPEQMKVIRTDFESDPLMAHLRTSHLPLYWDRQTFIEAGQLRLWDDMAALGYTHGIAVPLHTGRTTLFVFAMDWTDAAPLSLTDRAWAVTAAQTIALYAQPAAVRLWRQQDLQMSSVPPGITERQVECLLWASRGRTDAEIGRILEISARTARKHIDNIVEQLGASSRTEAVAIAASLNLLQASDLPSVDTVMPASMVENKRPAWLADQVTQSKLARKAKAVAEPDHGGEVGSIDTARPARGKS